jgi:hypothetical protein
VSEHLLLFPDRVTADEVAAELGDEDFSEVRVVRQPRAGQGRRSSAGPQGQEAHEWGVYVLEEMVQDESGPVAGGLRDRFGALAEERGGRYDPRPATPA